MLPPETAEEQIIMSMLLTPTAEDNTGGPFGNDSLRIADSTPMGDSVALYLESS